MAYSILQEGFAGRRARLANIVHIEVISGVIRKQYYGTWTHPAYLNWFFSPLTVSVSGIVLICAILLLSISKIVLDIYKEIMLAFLERAVEEDPDINPKGFMPGTLIGSVMGVVAAITKAVHQLWVLWR